MELEIENVDNINLFDTVRYANSRMCFVCIDKKLTPLKTVFRNRNHLPRKLNAFKYKFLPFDGGTFPTFNYYFF